MFTSRSDGHMRAFERKAGGPVFKITTNLTRRPIVGASHQKTFGAVLTKRGSDAWTDIKRRHVWFYLGRRAWYIRLDYSV